ncbi:MAG: hypothetical protein IIZ33_05100, partial [Erysipelotrichaceae bacterium]|nr:hypothetical protein [Erysipelotrichaceae bacterium]
MPLANKIRKTLWALRNRRRLMDVLREEYIKEEETAVLEIKQKEEEGRRRLEEEQKAKEEKERKIALIAGSPYFDRDYYARNNIEFQNSELDMAEHYLLYGGFLGKDPGPYFSSEEYLSLHSDVAMEGLNPLLHYEEHGKRENREISYLQRKEPSFPKEAVELERSFDISPSIHHRSAVVSCFLPEGRIPGSLLYLLKEVKKVTDNIVLAGDCPVIESELEKLKGIVFHASFKRHGQYDFGSYKRGLACLRQEGILDEELILLNDSVYGPVYPFEESFEKMTGKGDFWGYVSLVSRGVPYLSSCFLVFRKEVLESWVLDGFLYRVKGSYERGDIVTLFETKLTPYLRERGFEYASYVPEEDHINIFDQPLTLLKKYRMPLLKKKALLRKPIEDLGEVLKTVEREAPELYKEISYTPYEEKLFFPPSFEELEASYREKEERLKEKYERGEKLKALFLITNPSMFPSFPLFERMKEDGHFKPYIAIIPDLRWPGKEEEDLKV